ncbi:MAG: electron transfer flavoprotein subunit alpha/FixB family protein [Phycisphaerales bacterium]|nr:electron transfer flavoprotein subunit alpha/FixB family protein [Phycisphaerales bacterium]
MSVLVYIDHFDGHIKPSSFEALSYGSEVAKLLKTDAVGVLIGDVKDDVAGLGKYGVKKVYSVATDFTFDAQQYAQAIHEVATKAGADVLVFSHNPNGKALAPRLAVRLQAGIVTGVVELPKVDQGFVVKKTVFSGKGFAFVEIQSSKKVVSVNPNSFKPIVGSGTATIEKIDYKLNTPKTKVIKVNKAEGEVPLTEATLVVSAGRGLKGPENWGMIESLAHTIHAATACSRPVADSGWRPHHEHVGQTGVQIAPDLYIAIGISGAIQHLAGVNRSKVIVVINKDPEAPFFKAADYGIVGDAFEVVPKLDAEFKKIIK